MTNFKRIDIDPGTISRLPFFRGATGRRLVELYDQFDAAILRLLDRFGAMARRLTLGLVFVWFGALKVIDRSPVADLVAETVYWLPSDLFVRGLGVWEIFVGLGLILGIGMRVVLALFLAQMLGTFLVLIVKPGESFQDGNPFLLTTIGEFVIKNLVLITAGLVIGSQVRRRSVEQPKDTWREELEP